MKKRFLIIFLTSTLLMLTFLPSIPLYADTSNLIINGDFETGDFTGWNTYNDLGGKGIYDIGDDGSNNYLVLKTDGEDSYAFIYQEIYGITNTDLVLNYRYWLKSYSSSAEPPWKNIAYIGLIFNKTGQISNVGTITHQFTNTTDSWSSLSSSINIKDEITSDFDSINIRLQVYRYEAEGGDLEICFDDVSLTECLTTSNSNIETVAIPEPKPWARDHDMTCWQVYINEDNNFEFIFWWLYGSNNWVKIYDMEDNLVFEKDLEYGEPVLEVDLPDGFYTVRTYHISEEPLQEFLIGKP